MTQERELSGADIQTLTDIAALMIPASQAHGIPAASDPAIMAEIENSARRDISAVEDAIRAFAGIDAATTDEKAETFRTGHPEHAKVLETLVVRCYYRDERVMKSLDMEPRAPFPKGFEVEQGDWSLLDPVRAMAPIYRRVE